ncbi:MAG: cytochrome [Gemmatimonadales bacterium]
MRRPIIAILGPSEASPVELSHARALGSLCARAGWIVLTGGRPAGVMAEAVLGAKEVPGSITIGILPDTDGPVAEGIDVAIRTDVGHARNNINVLTGDVVVACGVSSAGTASEVALALRNGRPTVLLGAAPEAVAFFRDFVPDLLHLAASPAGAVDIIENRLDVRRAPPWPTTAPPQQAPPVPAGSRRQPIA